MEDPVDEKMIRCEVLIPKSQDVTLKEVAESISESKSFIIRKAIRLYLSSRRPNK